MGEEHELTRLDVAEGTNDVEATAGSASVLTADLQAPSVTETTVQADLLHTTEVVTELVVELVSNGVNVLASLVVLATVQEPQGDTELQGGLDDGSDGLNLVLGELTSTAMVSDKRRRRWRTASSCRCRLP